MKEEKVIAQLRLQFILGMFEAFKACGLGRRIKDIFRAYPDITQNMFRSCVEKSWEVNPSLRIPAMRQITKKKFKLFIEDLTNQNFERFLK